MKTFLVPLMLFVSSVIMAFAWLGHLRFKSYPFLLALLASWAIVLPEYILNVSAIRYGHGTYTGGQMAAFNLASGVLCVALVAHFFLGEALSSQQVLGFVLMAISVILIVYKPAALDIKTEAGVRERAPDLPSVPANNAPSAE